jgi:hypothetical protein
MGTLELCADALSYLHVGLRCVVAPLFHQSLQEAARLKRSSVGHAQLQLLIAIHAKHPDGSATDGRLPDDPDTLPFEVILPFLVAGMEQRGRDSGVRADPREVASLVQTAVDARKAEVRLIIASAVLARTDVFDVKRAER